MVRITALLVATSTQAIAGTGDLNHQIRLLDVNGSPLQGDQRIEVRIVGDDDPAAPEDVCFSQITDPVAVEDGFASLRLTSVPDTCFETDRWVAVLVGNPGVELEGRTPVSSVPRAATAGSVDGMDFGESSDSTTDIKAYIDRLFCEQNGGTWNDSNGACDANMVVGTGSWNATDCPASYRVCTVPEVMQRAANVSVGSTWYWAAHESGAPTEGNLDFNGSRYSFPYCPASGNAPLVRLQPRLSGSGMEVVNVICYTSGYTPLCCK